MAQKTLIQFLRGNYADLVTGQAARPQWASDALRLYVDDGSVLRKIGPGAVASGSTLPTVNLTAGDLFLHNPTGRAYLMQYDGSAWQPVRSYGTATVYVNGSSGSDTQNNGHGTGANAYATIQYALNQLPPLIGDLVTINIAGGTYAENVSVSGKFSVGGTPTILLQGDLNTYASGIGSSASTQGGGATQGTVVRASGTWTSNEIQNKFIRFQDGTSTVALRGVARLVDSNTTTTATIVGYWPAAPGGSDTFDVLDWGTNATQIAPASGTPVSVANGPSVAVVLGYLYLNAANNISALAVDAWSRVSALRCRIANGAVVSKQSALTLGEYTSGDGCLVEYDLGNAYGDRVLYIQRSQLELYWSKVLGTGTLDFGYVYGVLLDNGSFGYIDLGTVIEGQVTGGTPSNGVYLTDCSTCLLGDGATSDPRVRTWDRGVRVETNCPARTNNVSYSGNTTNESADAGSYASIV